ncbi:DUF1549 domain-containing protein [Roseiconus lacunae]|uniref:DUF1549 domain-containing protein n=1 Tax=Roseiconus lacunae TaxID=2605694 RepID=UPI001E52143F|nr:DUF1549 domain-containing protein [Roseiconus lacunae]MCD0460638.1 DUF1549 and DUF1553 domain-containing protein [Roseiconus lacunae]
MTTYSVANHRWPALDRKSALRSSAPRRSAPRSSARGWMTLCRSVLGMVVALTIGSGFAHAEPGPEATLETAPATTGRSPIETINYYIEQGWTDYEITPSKEADDLIWCRRVHLDIIGRVPTMEEMKAFMADRKSDRRKNLVERLLHDDRYTEEYSNHWATVWANLLIGRSGGMDRRDLTNRDGMMKYLRDSFAANKPYNQMVFELVTAEGATKPGAPGFNGAVNFLVDKVNDEKAVLAASSVSRIFLGQQVQCTQCHNHPFNDWKQQKFWEFNSFFRQSRALRRYVDGTRDIEFAELVSEDFAGEAGDPSDALVFYEMRNGLTRVAYPVFTDGTEIEKSGFVDEVNRRKELGRLMLDSEALDLMAINRHWSIFLGHGFTRPIDDMGPHTNPSHPELLEELAAEFRKYSYNIKDLITWITLSKPYGLSAALGSNNAIDDPSVGETPKFSRFYLRQISAEQLYQSLVSLSGGNSQGTYEQQERKRREWMQQFVVTFGTDEGDEATTFDGSIPQALMLFNGELTRNATSTKPGSFLAEIAVSGKTISDRLNRLYLAGLARRPSKRETRLAGELYRANGGDEAEMMQDLWWAILNSNEFIMQH